MSEPSFRTRRPAGWSAPRPVADDMMRRYVHGPIQPMVPPTLLERLFARF